MRVLESEHPRPLDLLAIGAGGHVAVSCSLLGVRPDVEVWDLTSGAILYAYQAKDGAGALAFVPDGDSLIVAEWSEVVVVKPATGTVRTALEDRHPRLA